MVRTMLCPRHLINLLSSAFLSGILSVAPLQGQVPAIPRAEPVAEPETKPEESESAPSGPAEGEYPLPANPTPALDKAGTLGALIREQIPYALVVESAGNGSEVFVPIPGAKSSGLTAARWGIGVMRPYSREEFRALDLKWKDFRIKGLQAAESHFALMEPAIDRDSRGTVELVRYVSESPLTATCLFTQAFRDNLEDTLGLPFYAAAPSRSVILAFAKSGGDPPSIRSLAQGLFNDSIYPASLEIFEVGKDGVRVVGTFSDD